LCRAVDIFEKSVEQSRFEQMHFEQFTLTHLHFKKETFSIILIQCIKQYLHINII